MKRWSSLHDKDVHRETTKKMIKLLNVDRTAACPDEFPIMWVIWNCEMLIHRIYIFQKTQSYVTI